MDDHANIISVEQLAAQAMVADVRIVDCRFDLFAPEAGRAAYLDAHIPAAVYADLNQDLAAPVTASTGRHPLPSVSDCAATFGRLGIGENTFVVVYDEQNGAIAARAWWMLRWLGHPQVAVLDGGLAAWRARQLPLDAGNVLVTPRTFIARPRNERIIASDEVIAAIENGLPLIDARAAARFAGDIEPIDAIAGHIPGARNLPFERSLDASGRWKSAGELRRLWADVLGDGTGASWSVMCGSGVTACHLALSAELAGLAEPRLYVGSWSEWIRDGGRPIAKGAV